MMLSSNFLLRRVDSRLRLRLLLPSLSSSSSSSSLSWSSLSLSASSSSSSTTCTSTSTTTTTTRPRFKWNLPSTERRLFSSTAWSNNDVHHSILSIKRQQHHQQHQQRESFFSFSLSNGTSDDTNSESDNDEDNNNRRRTQELIIVRHGVTNWNQEGLIQGGRSDVELNSMGREQAEKAGVAIRQYLLHTLSQQQQQPQQEEEETETDEGAARRKKLVTIQLYASPLLRTVETAQLLSEQLKGVSCSSSSSTLPIITSTLPIITSNALQEWDLHCLEGLTVEQATEHYPTSWQIVKEWDNPYVEEELTTIPIEENGESMEHVRIRLESYFENIVHQSATATAAAASRSDDNHHHNDVIIIVTHGAVLGQLLRHVLVTQHDDGHQEQEQYGGDDEMSAYHRPVNACITRITICPDTWKWKIVDWANADHLQ